MKSFEKLCVFFIIGCVLLFSSAWTANVPAIQYILYVRPDGNLGTDLSNYWYDVKHSKRQIAHEAITKYPPHCTITSFFIPTQDDNFYLNAIPLAIAQADLHYARAIQVTHQLRRGNEVDRIVLTSNYLTALGLAFAAIVGLEDTYVKGPPGPAFHITLRDHVFVTEGKLEAIQELQDQDINLYDSSGWLVYLYKCVNNVMIPIGSPVRLIP